MFMTYQNFQLINPSPHCPLFISVYLSSVPLLTSLDAPSYSSQNSLNSFVPLWSPLSGKASGLDELYWLPVGFTKLYSAASKLLNFPMCLYYITPYSISPSFFQTSYSLPLLWMQLTTVDHCLLSGTLFPRPLSHHPFLVFLFPFWLTLISFLC